ncbi:Heat shock 70 kDa protein 12A [Actinomortierella wolfii]|nr:Heat shock 70 kDa protein 12A [Actinomortierella wolfii]
MHSGIFNIDDFPVLVAIDFGTTFSGCAYAYTPQDQEPKLISEWPRGTPYYAKAPTINVYKIKGTKGKPELASWGWDAKLPRGPTKSDYIQLYKYKIQLDEMAVLPWVHHISVSEAISDYLKAIHEYSAGVIEQQIGNRFTRTSFRYCLTVPAMWSDRAKDTMRQAAIQAGLITQDDHPDRLMLVSEPEAAALYCEKECNEYDLKDGDRFLICDAGGGTVDLIVYDVTLTDKGRNLSEVTKGHGATCGSMFVDLNFGDLLSQKFQSQGANIQDDIIVRMVKTFAFELKPHFDGSNEIYLELPLDLQVYHIKDPETIGIDEGVMLFEASELKEKVFDPVVKQVLDLIQGQLDSATNCSAIFLVGGFGSSAYLLKRVKQAFGSTVKTISAPYRPEIAVVKGAVYAGMGLKKITARATRRCYGISVKSPFERGVDPPELMEISVEGLECRDRFYSFVKQGQLVKVNECVSDSFYFVYEGPEKETDSYGISIYAINGDPPRYVTNLCKSAQIRIPSPFIAADKPGKKSI